VGAARARSPTSALPVADNARLLIETERLTQAGSWEMDLRSLQAVWSDGMYRIHGIQPGRAAPGVAMLLSRTHREDRDRLAHLLQTVVDHPEQVAPEGIEAEYRAVREDGSVREVRFRGFIEREDGAPARWIGTAQDVTEQWAAERELHCHYAVGQALRDWVSFEEGVVGLLRRMVTALEFTVGAVWVLDKESERLACRAFWVAPAFDPGDLEAVVHSIRLEVGQGLPGRAWQQQHPIVVPDLPEAPDTLRRTVVQRVGLRSGLALPALGPDGPVAVLSFYSREPRQPSAHIMRTLTGIGRELGRFLDARRGQLEPAPLTARELEVLGLAADGASGPEIAERLVVGHATVKTHFENIYEKLGVGDRAAAVAHALRLGLLR
jgi:DNA-binding CsgD family transcriptional regulator